MTRPAITPPALLLALATVLALPVSATAAGIGALELLGEAFIAPDSAPGPEPVGGLSGLAYDAKRRVFYALSDDPATRGPARFYTLEIDLEDGRLEDGEVRVKAVVELVDADGSAFAESSIDAEGIALAPGRTLFIASEGQADRLIDPFLREFSLGGRQLGALAVPRKYLPDGGKTRGVRHNLAFESMTFAADGRWLFTSTENALRQDGPAADVGVGSRSRILRFNARSRRLAAEYVYRVDPVPQAPARADAFRTNGLVELLALSSNRLLALERSYVAGAGNRFRLYSVSLARATNVKRWKQLDGRRYRPAEKELLFDSVGLGRRVDNIEGMALGPTLADGRRSLVMIADNNFNDRQTNQVLAFAVSEGPLEAGSIQGRGHRSPFSGTRVRDLEGVVTARATNDDGFWLQSARDGDSETSDALLVLPEQAEAFEPEPGARIRVAGTVVERGFPAGLTVTALTDAVVSAVVEPARRAALPAPVRLVGGERTLPREHIDDDGLSLYQPGDDAIDFYESLEGMRLELDETVAIGPTTRFGEFAVLLDAGRGSEPRSAAGGLVATAGAVHPERFLVVPAKSATGAPSEPLVVAVGDRFAEPLTGVLEYAYGSFRLALEEPPPVRASGFAAERSTLSAADRVVLVASYNVENLSPRSGRVKFDRLARTIVDRLGSPDILALQEIQDDTGPDDDGTVSATATLTGLAAAVADAGGPAYDFVQVDPVDAADGGQPGGNIRVAYLYRGDRVGFVGRGSAGAGTRAEWFEDERGPFLSPNPARVDPAHPAFAGDPELGLGGTRKPLAAEFEFAGQRLFLVNVHFRSKRGDAPLFGSAQPPSRSTEAARTGEARVVKAFVDRLLELDRNAHVIVLGDFNEHPYREPLEVMTASGLVNLVTWVPLPERYTFNFRGSSQVLDNVLVTAPMVEELAPAVDIVHANVDFPHRERASDHEPIVVRFEFALRTLKDDS